MELVKSDRHPVTTNQTIAEDLRASLRARGVPAGTTLGDLIDALQSLGLRTSDPLGGIEYGMGQGGSGRIFAEWEDGCYVIREAR